MRIRIKGNIRRRRRRHLVRIRIKGNIRRRRSENKDQE